MTEATEMETIARNLGVIPAEKGYNGWTNYETWCVNLWLTNDEYSESELRKIATHWRHYEREDALRTFIRDAQEEAVPQCLGMFSDLLQSALDNVNWREIIKAHEEDND